MRSRITKLFLGISLVAALSGCTAVGKALNPYEDEFKCSKKAPFGTCENTMEVYADLVAAPKGTSHTPVATEPAGVPAGYEIVASPEALPSYSVAGAESVPAPDRYVVAKKPAPEKDESAPLPQSDAGDGVVYPQSKSEKQDKAAPVPVATLAVRPKPETAYRDASLAKAAKLLKEPVTPVVIPPVVMRILILPRRGEDGELNMAQFSYVMVDKPKWAMGDYLSVMPEE